MFRIPKDPRKLIAASITSMAVTVLALNPVSCSKMAPAAALDPDNIDPCSLLTAAEAQSALGMAVAPGSFLDDGLFRHCQFKGVKGDGEHYVTVSLRVMDKSRFDNPDPRQFERASGTALDAFFGENSSDTPRMKASEIKLAELAVNRF